MGGGLAGGSGGGGGGGGGHALEPLKTSQRRVASGPETWRGEVGGGRWARWGGGAVGGGLAGGGRGGGGGHALEPLKTLSKKGSQWP